MSTFVSHLPHVKAPNQREGIACGYSHLWHASNLISAAHEKQRYEIAPSSTGEGIRQSGQVRYAIYPRLSAVRVTPPNTRSRVIGSPSVTVTCPILRPGRDALPYRCTWAPPPGSKAPSGGAEPMRFTMPL